MTVRKRKERKTKATSKISEMMMREKIIIRNTKVWLFLIIALHHIQIYEMEKRKINQRKLMMMVRKKKII